MTKDEMIAGLKSGRTLIVDGWSSPKERQAIRELLEEGLINISDLIVNYEDQYSYHRVTWKKPEQDQ